MIDTQRDNALYWSTYTDPNCLIHESELHLTRDDIPDVLVGMLSQTGFKVMQKCIFYQFLFFYLLINITGESVL